MITSKIRQITVLLCASVLIVLIAQARYVAFGDNILQNSDFEGSTLPWEMYVDPGGDAAATMGRIVSVADNPTEVLCANVTSVNDLSSINWHIQMRQQGLTLEAGHTYNISFDIYADQEMTLTAQMGQSGPPYRVYWQNYAVSPDGTAWTTITGTHTFAGDADGNDDTAVELAFHMGSSGVPPYMVCIDNVVVDDPDFVPDASIPTKEGVFPIRTNQVGYTEAAPKIASYVNSRTSPMMWQLLNSGGTVVASGMTTVFGYDADSGQDIHQIDFSSYTTAGNNYTLQVGSDMSHAFTISDGIYNTIKYDALKYFYHNRSGIEIEAQHTGGANHSFASDAQWARDVAHLSDTAVTCWPNQAAYSCDYFLDVSKGWYDAGDHGKYVVNGGISAWTLMNIYERNPDNYADGTLNIPESGNGVSDVLDEARWEMEFMLGMQVPDGEALAGMVHHKIHNEEWTGLPYDPATDTIPRWLVEPSTAATLNLAATAAQCARIWATIDAAFSAECWTAAEKAWNAAEANPIMLFTGADNDNYPGGGPYSDTNVSDELYWAAAELYITADALGDGDAGTYQSEMNSYSGDIVPVGNSSMAWPETASLGTISRAVVQGDATAQNAIVSAADAYTSYIDSQGYNFPYDGNYPWGSISDITNNGIILGLAYDFTNNIDYVDAVGEGLNHIFGRNAMDQSYVTGHGENPLLEPHHRFWSGSVSGSFPYAPPGAISGGPNAGAVDNGDPVAISELPGCTGSAPPQTCFIDAIGSWATNEITVNWNSPFAWVLSFYDEVVNTAGIAITPTPAPTNMPTSTPRPVQPTVTPNPIQPTPMPTAVPPVGTVANILVNGGFVGFLDPWWADPTATTLTLGANGAACGAVPDGIINPWDGIFGQNDLTIEQDVTYQVEFVGYSPDGADATVNIGMQVVPYDSYASDTFTLSASPQTYSFQFTMDSATDSETNLTFQIGGQGAVTVCVDDVFVSPLGGVPTAVSSNLNGVTTSNIVPLLIITLIMTIGCTAAWVRFGRN